MNVRAHSLSPAVARRIAIICAAVVVASAHTAWAGINVWTNNGPRGGLVYALAIDPHTPSTLYAGTDFDVFKSADAGATWAALNTEFTFPYVGALAIDPLTPTTLYAGTLGGVFKSTDAGATWGERLDHFPRAIDPKQPSTLYGTDCVVFGPGGPESCGILESTDAGRSWQIVLDTGTNRLGVVIDPHTPSTLYTVGVRVLKSTDGGGSWNNTGFGGDVFALAIDPHTPSTLYAGTPRGVIKSTDAGATWDALDTGLTQVFALAIDPNTPTTLYAATDGGVVKSTDAGATWNAFNTGLPVFPYYTRLALAIDPIAPTTLYAVTAGGVFSIQQGAAKVVGTGTADSCTDAALNAALAGGGLVTFDCGPDPVTIDISTGTGTKTITTDTTIDGGGLITISGGNTVGVFRVDPEVDFTVNNLTIANGGYCFGAEGLICYRAIANYGSSLTVTNSTFSGNRGGGIVDENPSSSGTLTVTNSTFTDNGSLIDGGGVITHSGSGTITVTNSTFTGNTNGISNFGNGELLRITNSTFTDNYYGNISSNGTGSGTLTVTNTILANFPSGGPNCDGSITDGGHNLDSGTSCSFSTANGSLSDTDAQLDPAGLRDNGGPTQTVALCTAVDEPAGCATASPAIGAGDQTVCDEEPVNNLDQRGFVRPGIGRTQCSIGAYEADAGAPEACVGDCDDNGRVAINELVLGVSIVLDVRSLSACPALASAAGMVDVAQLVKGVNNSLHGCGSKGTP